MNNKKFIFTNFSLEMELEEAEDDYDDEKYDENGNEEMRIRGTNDEDDEEDEEENNEIVGARPRRISHLASQKSQKPIPKASSLFILFHTNPFRVFCNVNFKIFVKNFLIFL